MIEEDSKKYEYLGDGAYAMYDGYSIWLLANDHKNPSDKVCLELSVFRNLLQFAKQIEFI